jgi:hypothetical protein
VTLASNVATEIAAISAAGVDQGLNPQLGCTNAMITAINAAVTARRNADTAAEQARQAAVAVAKSVLRAANDFGPV